MDKDEFEVFINPVPQTPSITFDGEILRSSPAQEYQWYLNGNILPGETNITHAVLQNGTYHVVTGNGNCLSPNSDDFVINNLGITQESLGQHLMVYPNPSSGLFNLQLSNTLLSEVQTIEIINVLGQTIQDLELKEFQMVNLWAVESGMFFVRLTTKSSILTRRIVKQ